VKRANRGTETANGFLPADCGLDTAKPCLKPPHSFSVNARNTAISHPAGKPAAIFRAATRDCFMETEAQLERLERQFRKGLITADEYDAALLSLVTPEQRAEAEAKVDAAMDAKLALRY